jgi:CRISPR-associated protein Cas1
MGSPAQPAWTLADLEVSLLESAWERVRDNEGCAGVDGVTIEQYAGQVEAGLPELRLQLQNATYIPLPLRQIVVEKKLGSQSYRTLLVPTVRDRVAQTAIGRLLARDWEQEFLSASYAYRPGRGLDTAIQQIVSYRNRGWTWVVDADITAYFESISHNQLERQLAAQPIAANVLHLLHIWIHAFSWDGRELRPLKRGIPQGSPISPLLANLFLTPFDEELERNDSHLIRYSDDFIILCKSEAAARQALTLAAQCLKQEDLTLHADKTRITSFEEGFHYLGVTFRRREVMIPWKPKMRMGHIISIARPMSRRDLSEFRRDYAPQHRTLQPERPRPAPGHPIPETPQLDMAFLYITQPGSVLRKSGERFLVECDQHILLDCPAHRLESILLFGGVQITSQAVAEALDDGIGVSFFSQHGRFRGALSPGFGRNVDLRLAQYKLYADLPARLVWARATLSRKIANGLEVVERYEERNRAEDRTAALREQMERAVTALADAQSIAELDGMEGSAARAYFEALFTNHNHSPFSWPGRVKHPATDPLNALLSLGYTMLMNELLGLAEARGLDPALGFLHELDGNRPSLALDLMEPFRHAAVDRMVLTAVNRNMFTQDDFSDRGPQSGLALKPEAFRRYLEEYERSMLSPMTVAGGAEETRVTFRALLQAELDQLARALRGTEPWAPFAFPPAVKPAPPAE